VVQADALAPPARAVEIVEDLVEAGELRRFQRLVAVLRAFHNPRARRRRSVVAGPDEETRAELPLVCATDSGRSASSAS